MEKLFLIVILALTFSCTTNDSHNNNNNEISGTWKIEEINFFQDTNGVQIYRPSAPIDEDNSCFFQSNIHFNSNNTITYNYYTVVNGNCILSKDIFLDFSWIKLSGSRYELKYTYFGESYEHTLDIQLVSSNMLEIKDINGSSISHWLKI